MTAAPVAARRPWILAGLLIVGGALGWWASFALTIDKLILLENPDAILDCAFNLLVTCGPNLDSWQGSLLGFPNSLLGLGAFVAPIAVGVSLLAGARFDRWFWIAFNVGLLGALAFVVFLIVSSIYFLGSLCPWCMLVWSVTIPMFLAVTARNLQEGVFGGGRAVGRFALSWIVPITVACYAVVALLAQLRLDWLSYL